MAHVIRRARPDDAPAIQACARQAYARYVPRIGRPPRQWLRIMRP